MTRLRSTLVIVSTLATLGSTAAFAGPGTVPTGFHDELLAGGLNWPVAIALLPDGRVLVTEQFSGRIRLVVNGAISVVDPVCTVPGVRNNPSSEQGLLGLAIDPQWPSRPYVYVHYDAASEPTIHISRFTVAGDLNFTGNGSLTIDPASRFELITDIPDIGDFHNGGTTHFGPDGRLYVSQGEDGDDCAAQDTTLLKGKILRLEVAGLPAGPGGPPARSAITPADNPFVGHPNLDARLVWTLGLRNPFRFWIDTNGELFVGDVGEDVSEEIDRVPAGGVDLGWPLFEGSGPHGVCPGFSTAGKTGPIHSYSHVTGGYAVIGGPVIRTPCGTQLPAGYVGNYFFGDYYKGFLRRLVGSGTSWALAAPVAGQPNANDWGTGFLAVSDWASDCAGRLVYCRQAVGFADFTGEIRRIEAGSTADVPPTTPRVDFRPPWPSPAHDVVNLDFALSFEARVGLSLFDAGGRRIRDLIVGESRVAGQHHEAWDGRDRNGAVMSPGIYFASLEVDGRTVVRHFVRL